MTGNSTAACVRACAGKTDPRFQRRCLAAMLLLALATAQATGHAQNHELPAEHAPGSGESSDAKTGSVGGVSYTIRDGYAYAQGDIVLGRVGPDGRLRQRNTGRGLGLNANFGRWPNGVITYTLSENLSAQKRININDAIAQINSLTRISILERTPELAMQYPDNWVNFIDGTACASYVGANAGDTPAQNIWVAPQCTTGSVIHEIAHTIGLFHEHTRPDRDQYITVLEDNIADGSEHNFAIISAGADNYSSYDYGSIMHYGEYFFSTDPMVKRTIRTPDGESIGQRERLSEKDIESINRMYATDLSLSIDTRSDGSLTEVDVTVSNNGSLGAHRIFARLALPTGSQWNSVSQGSGWDCVSDDEELSCARDVIESGETSRFVLVADTNASSADELVVALHSRTLDTNASNNGFNDDGRWSHLADEPALASDGVSDPVSDDGAPVPNIAAGNPFGSGDDEALLARGAATTSADGSSGGGAFGPFSLLLTLIVALFRANGRVRPRPGGTARPVPLRPH